MARLHDQAEHLRQMGKLSPRRRVKFVLSCKLRTAPKLLRNTMVNREELRLLNWHKLKVTTVVYYLPIPIKNVPYKLTINPTSLRQQTF